MAALQNTKVTDEHTVTVPGYQQHYMNCNGRGGGVTMLIIRGIDHYTL